MKIAYNKPEINTRFIDITNGTVFRHEGKIFIKIEECKNGINAVLLRDGSVASFSISDSIDVMKQAHLVLYYD